MSNMIVAEQVGQLARPTAASVVMPMAPAGFAAGGGITGKDILRIFRKRMWMIVIMTLVFVAIAGVITFFWLRFSPFYTADAFLQLNMRTNPMRDDGDRMMAQTTVDRLLLSWVRVVNQETVYLEVLNEGSSDYNIRGTEWYRMYSDNPVRELQKQVTFSPTAAAGIRVSMTGRDPREAARIVNAVAYQAERRAQSRAEGVTGGVLQLLTDEAQNITDKLKIVRDNIASARPFDIPMFEEARSGLFMKIGEDTRRIASLRVQEVAARAAVDLAEREDLRNSPEVLYALDVDLEIRALKNSKVYQETQYANLLRMFGPQHREVQAMKTRIESATERIADMQQAVIEKTVGSIKANRQAVLASIQEQLRALFMSLEDSETRLKDNEKSLDRLRQLHTEERQLTESFRRVDEKIRDVRLQQRAEVPLVLVAPALPPAEPSMPRWSIMIPVGLILGLLVGVGLAFLLELTDSSVKTSDDIARRMDLPVLGMIPHADDLEDDIRDVRLTFMTNPNSLLGESFRQLRTCLRFSGSADRRRSLLVSSPMPEDGRTTVAVNLGAAMARDGMKVLVIDANFRQPSIRKLFPQASDAGLSNVLSGQSAWQDVVCLAEPNLAVISSGSLPPNPAELLGSPAMRRLIAELGEQFDQVIFDGAPALIVSDSPILATAVDATMLVIRAGVNTHDVVQRARETFRHVGPNLIGVTLNGVRSVADGYLRRSYNAFYEYHEQLPGR